MKKVPKKNLLIGRRALEHIPFIRILSDLQWYSAKSKWNLQCSIEIENDGLIPKTSFWCILVDDNYPWGEIDIYPTKDGGIQKTFYHQRYNHIGDEKYPWRDGNICTHTSLRAIGRRMYDFEPFNAQDRLYWHAYRLREWIIAANENKLIESGDPFELPDFPGRSSNQEVSFIEDDNSFAFWETNKQTYGLANILNVENKDKLLKIISFSDVKYNAIRTIQYKNTKPEKSNTIGIWIKLPKVPYIDPWQAPAIYDELVKITTELGVDIEDIVKNRLIGYLRDGREHLLLLGFPIPCEVGGNNKRYHWQPLMLPIFSYGKPKGFPPSEKGYKTRDRAYSILSSETKLNWIMSRNWEYSEIYSRGRMPENIADSKILLIGLGAIGSMISELLIRNGCKEIIIIDNENLNVGNLSRHTLQLNDVGNDKATSLKIRLESINPYANVVSINSAFPPKESKDVSLLQDCDIVIDCTANDNVLDLMSRFNWGKEKYYFSASVGMESMRLIFYSSHGIIFPHASMLEKIEPLIKAEVKEYEGSKLPREGIGCWSPVFPARVDDIWLMAAVAVKSIEEIILNKVTNPSLQVFEQVYENDRFIGLSKLG